MRNMEEKPVTRHDAVILFAGTCFVQAIYFVVTIIAIAHIGK